MMLAPSRLPVEFVSPPARQVPVSQRVNLLPIVTVRVILGLTADELAARITAGGILWVFDLGINPRQSPNRNLRVWADEIIDPKAVRVLALGDVINLILGERETFTRADLATRWVLNRFNTCKMVKNGLPEAKGQISRQSLVEFLARRWVGSMAGLKKGGVSA